MGTISKVKANYLFWLGRYAERVFSTIEFLNEYYDQGIDRSPDGCKDFCTKLGITYHYASKSEFLTSMISDTTEPYSLIRALESAHDNAIMLRDELGSRSLSFIQLAKNDLDACIAKRCRSFDLTKVTDDILGFWGCADDAILIDTIRDIIKSGKYTERIDLYVRFGKQTSLIRTEVARLERYARHLPQTFDPYHLTILTSGAANLPQGGSQMLRAIPGIFNPGGRDQ